MDYLKINQKIDELTNSGLYDESQLEAIRYVSNFPNFNVNLILDPTIPSDMMLMYFKLAQTHKVDVSKYISEKWHQKGFNDKQLSNLIFYASKGCNISGITPDLSEDVIKNLMDAQQRNVELKKLFESSNMSVFELDKLKEYNLDYTSIKFLLKKGEEEDLTNFLSNNLTGFSSEQIKYLYSVYSTGSSIGGILNPSLSIEQMKNKILNSRDSVEFTLDIYDNLANKQK